MRRVLSALFLDQDLKNTLGLLSGGVFGPALLVAAVLGARTDASPSLWIVVVAMICTILGWACAAYLVVRRVRQRRARRRAQAATGATSEPLR